MCNYIARILRPAPGCARPPSGGNACGNNPGWAAPSPPTAPRSHPPAEPAFLSGRGQACGVCQSALPFLQIGPRVGHLLQPAGRLRQALGPMARHPQLIPQRLTRPPRPHRSVAGARPNRISGRTSAPPCDARLRRPPQLLPGSAVSHQSAQVGNGRGVGGFCPPANFLRGGGGDAVVLLHGFHLRKGV